MKRENSGNRSGRPSSGAPRKSASPRGGSGSAPRKRTSSSNTGGGFARSKDAGEGRFEKKARPSSSSKPYARKSEDSSFERKPRTGGSFSKEGASSRPYARKSDDKSFERKPRTGGSFSKEGASIRPYARKSDDKSFERKPRTGGSFSKEGASSRPYVRKSEDSSFERKPRTGGSFSKEGSSTRPYARKSADSSFERKPRTSGSFSKEGSSSRPYARKSEDSSFERKPITSSSSQKDSKPYARKSSDRPAVGKDKKYGSAGSFKERKEMKSIHEINAEEKSPRGRYDKRNEGDSFSAGKGKFTKKSELKGFKPRSSGTDDDFRFKPPGSRGKSIDLGNKPEFVSKSKSQSKERITEDALSVGESVRLNRFISNAGVCSRREADELIGAGLVSINGTVVTELGSKVKAGDVVRFNGEKLAVEAKVYIVLNKPKDAITTADDPDGRNTVMDIFDGKMRERIFPIGRLDRNTTGVLLLTNDGELANRLMHPKYEIKKVYKATLNKNLKPTDLWSLSNGVELEDGFIKPDAIAQSDAKNKNVVGIEIHSGKNRIIHRMFEHLDYSVEKLDRVLYAGIEKGPLKRGEWRELNDKELKILKRNVHLK